MMRRTDRSSWVCFRVSAEGSFFELQEVRKNCLIERARGLNPLHTFLYATVSSFLIILQSANARKARASRRYFSPAAVLFFFQDEVSAKCLQAAAGQSSRVHRYSSCPAQMGKRCTVQPSSPPGLHVRSEGKADARLCTKLSQTGIGDRIRWTIL